ncbi:MAG: DUF1801 domain-containing protein [Verrucomicrobia bacterium]|nr:DUF1801 domain-containing protein [Verrucomicrobiota bacterium]
MKSFSNKSVEAVFESYSPRLRKRMLHFRKLIFDAAKRTPGVGKIEETLRWGQPSYLTPETNSGSTLRIDSIKSKPGGYAMYVHCQTTLLDSFKECFGDTFRYEGNRAIIFSETESIPDAKLSECIALALTYHLEKNRKRVPVGQLINKSKE